MTPPLTVTHSPVATERRLVWDLPLRLFHWLFAASVLASWATAEMGVSWMKWHLRLGNWMMGLVVFRILWGLAGPRHARFSSFLTGPRKICSYARGLTGTGRVINSVGHNPLGGLMVSDHIVGAGNFFAKIERLSQGRRSCNSSSPYREALSMRLSGRRCQRRPLNRVEIW
jgi:hypothetical protein